MQISTETDGFIAQQIAPLLRPHEAPQCAAYLLTEASGSIVSALGIKAFFAVLTTERLLLVETRVGAFRPLLETIGVTAFERREIAGAYVQWGRVTLRLEGGRDLVFRCAASNKHVSSQGAFRDLLSREHGGPVAEALARNRRWTTVAAAAVSIALVGAVFYTSHRENAEVKVLCSGEALGMRCTAQHTSGGAVAHACWDIVLKCANKKTPRQHACVDVAPKEKATVFVSNEQFTGLAECDQAIGKSIVGLTVE